MADKDKKTGRPKYKNLENKRSFLYEIKKHFKKKKKLIKNSGHKI